MHLVFMRRSCVEQTCNINAHNYIYCKLGMTFSHSGVIVLYLSCYNNDIVQLTLNCTLKHDVNIEVSP